MTVIPPEAERHVYANSTDQVAKVPLSSKLWIEVTPGQQITYWNLSGNGLARRRRTRRQIAWAAALVVFVLAVAGASLGAAYLYVQSQLG